MVQRIDMHAAAARAGVSYSTLRQHHYKQQISGLLTDFPAPCARGQKLLWLDTDIDAWMAAQSTYPAPSASAPPVLASKTRGRPRKIAVGGEGGA